MLFMRKFWYIASVAMAFGLLSCGNSSKTVDNEPTDQDTIIAPDVCCTDDLEDSADYVVARGSNETFDVKATSEGPGENKPCHVSGCKCKFGYAGNWDAKYCNKCNHEMSKHY